MGGLRYTLSPAARLPLGTATYVVKPGGGGGQTRPLVVLASTRGNSSSNSVKMRYSVRASPH